MQDALASIYKKIAETGEVTQEQLVFISFYERKNNDFLKTIVKYGSEINEIIDKLFPVDGGNK